MVCNSFHEERPNKIGNSEGNSGDSNHCQNFVLFALQKGFPFANLQSNAIRPMNEQHKIHNNRSHESIPRDKGEIDAG